MDGENEQSMLDEDVPINSRSGTIGDPEEYGILLETTKKYLTKLYINIEPSSGKPVITNMKSLLAHTLLRQLYTMPDFLFQELVQGGKGGDIDSYRVGLIHHNAIHQPWTVHWYSASVFHRHFDDFAKGEYKSVPFTLLNSFNRLLVSSIIKDPEILNDSHIFLMENFGKICYTKNTKGNTVDVVMNNIQSHGPLISRLLGVSAQNTDLFTGPVQEKNTPSDFDKYLK